MALGQLFRDFKQLRQEFRDLTRDSVAAEERASFRLVNSARRFSRRTKNVVDNKLSFSATLMRAGEVHAANRLLEEVERDVRTEEAALIETMNEVKVQRATTRERMTRLRLARMVAVCLAGSMLMGFSALGMAAAGFVQNREADEIRENVAQQRRAIRTAREIAAGEFRGLDKNVRKQLKGVKLTLAQAQELVRLTEGPMSMAALQNFLADVLPTVKLARQVAGDIVAQVHPVGAVVAKAAKSVDEATVLVAKMKKRAEQASEETEEPQEEEQAAAAAEEEQASEDPPDGEAQEKNEKEGSKGNDNDEDDPLDGTPLGD